MRQKTRRKSPEPLFVTKLVSILNMLIDQHARVTIQVIRQGNKPCPLHRVESRVRFTEKMVFQTDSENWLIMLDDGVRCSPLHPAGFVSWVETSFDSFHSAPEGSERNLKQPSLKFARL